MRFYLFIFIVSTTMACNDATDSNRAAVNNKPANAIPVNNNAAANNTENVKVPEYSYEIVKTYNHDPQAFTQGLIYYNDALYEGTGGSRARGDNFYSSLRKVSLDTGKVEKKFDLADDYFGEGITIFKDKIYQITWREHKAFVYDVNDFKLLKEFNYSGEGWGLTHDDTNLIMSDGTHVIRFVNPETFETVRTITILDEKGKPVLEINELEYIKGEIWANIWQKGEIIRIDPSNGKISGKIDFQKLMDDTLDKSPDADVLNGIAYDEKSDRIFITGKKWNKLYEVKIIPKG
ncbi:MAG: glutaminyl-peptide cyclotransferase [Pyrinomonadaceae bacterium]